MDRNGMYQHDMDNTQHYGNQNENGWIEYIRLLGYLNIDEEASIHPSSIITIMNYHEVNYGTIGSN
jgi:hypothetical protein